MENEYFREIYEKYYNALFLYAFSLCKNQQDAEDLVQSTFLKAFLAYESTGSLKYWLVTVLKHEYFNLWEKKQRLISEDMAVLENRPSEEKILEQLIKNEEKRRLYQLIGKLPELQKRVILDSVYFQLDDEEIAKGNNISRENVRQIRSRAKRKLLELVKEEEK